MLFMVKIITIIITTQKLQEQKEELFTSHQRNSFEWCVVCDELSEKNKKNKTINSNEISRNNKTIQGKFR